MRRNIGTLERILRIVIGLTILPLALTGPESPWAYAVIPLLTGLLGYCPIYRAFGISTYRPARLA